MYVTENENQTVKMKFNYEKENWLSHFYTKIVLQFFCKYLYKACKRLRNSTNISFKKLLTCK